MNLGTPQDPTFFAVRKFLRQFLWDPRVVEIPRLLWWLILQGIVLPFRTPRLVKLYRQIWTRDGSPLQVFTERLANKVAEHFSKRVTSEISVFYAMTYGTPTVKHALKQIEGLRVARLIVVPLFPQYSATTTGAVFDKLVDQLKSQRYIPSIHFVNDYAGEENYLQALAQSITQTWRAHGRSERLLFSFHGIPLRNEQLGDPYPERCKHVASRVAEILNIPENFWDFSFQSRFGFSPWRGPNTEERLLKWAGEGVKSVSVISPSFAVDCLETLEELDIKNRKCFLNAGGECYHYIPALNDTSNHTQVLTSLIENFFKKNIE